MEGALIKGFSGRADLCQLIGVFWSLVRRLRIEIYIDRVPTDSNLADTPSRGNLDVAKACCRQRRASEHLALTYEGLGMACAVLWTGETVNTGEVS